jgi:hypothetical protein
MSDPAEPEIIPAERVEVERGRGGRFVRGGKPGPGRPPKAENRIIRSIKESMIAAGERIGADGKGLNGIDGFLERVGREDPGFLASAIIRSTVPAARESDAYTGDADALATLASLDPAEQRREAMRMYAKGQIGRTDLALVIKAIEADQAALIEALSTRLQQLEKVLEARDKSKPRPIAGPGVALFPGLKSP